MAKKQVSWRLEAGNEWVARDPFGQVKAGDRSKRSVEVCQGGGIRLRAARNGYASVRLWVSGAGRYRLRVRTGAPGVEADLYRAWYHKMAPGHEKDGQAYLPDALVPVPADASQQLPDPDNAIPGQTLQEYWLDLFVTPDAAPGAAEGNIALETGADTVELPLRVEVLPDVIGDEDVMVCDHNSYGPRWAQGMYPSLFAGLTDPVRRWEKTVEVLHQYFRICHEHRGLFSNLGAGHHGGFDCIYGPETVGRGAGKGLTNWGLFDRHYGPVLDGSAFRSAAPGLPRPRRPARAVWGVYTPINVAWPADWLYWGQNGYEVEFVRCVREFDRHFRDNGWTTARPEFFFNHKKRYRWFEWDGDEPKYAKDHACFLEMGRLLRKAVGRSAVPWAYRIDCSWQMKNNFSQFAGVVDFYVCGGFVKWYGQEVAEVLARGDTVWSYSGTPGVEAPSSALLEHVFRTWARGLGGHCEWLTVAPGNDPWFACEGAATGMIYPGERFGLAGPVPSARLKLQRNAVQDVDLITARARRQGGEPADAEARQAVASRVPLPLWETPPAIVRQQPPEAWDNHNLSQQTEVNMAQYEPLDPLWWSDIRRAALEGRRAP